MHALPRYSSGILGEGTSAAAELRVHLAEIGSLTASWPIQSNYAIRTLGAALESSVSAVERSLTEISISIDAAKSTFASVDEHTASGLRGNRAL